MIRRPVRNLRSSRQVPPRVFDVIIENGEILLEIKMDRNRCERIPWPDVVWQVEAAGAEESK